MVGVLLVTYSSHLTSRPEGPAMDTWDTPTRMVHQSHGSRWNLPFHSTARTQAHRGKSKKV